MVLHHVSNDAKLVKISSSALSSKWFLEGDCNTGDVVPVPSGSKDHVPEPERYEVLDHLLAKIVINSVQLIFGE